MLKVNLKKLKAYGDRLDDGVVQLSFTLPVSSSPEAREAARIYAVELGLEKVSIATMEPMGKGFSYFVAYGYAKHTIDFTRIRVPMIDVPQMDFGELKDFMARNLEKPIVVIGAATGDDAHTVGIDAIMNMKGFAGDYGLERYPLFKAHNLRSQLTNQALIDKAVELKADAILISQVVTQRDSHIKNLKGFKELASKDPRLPRQMIFVVGGPRLDHSFASKLGFDAGYGTGTKPSQVANFIVHEYMKRHGIKERRHDEAPRHVHCEPAAEVETSKPEIVKKIVPVDDPIKETPAVGQKPSAGQPPHGAHRKRRRRGRRGGRRHRKKPAAGSVKSEA